VKVKLGKTVTARAEKFKPMCLLLGGNDTVPISVYCSGRTGWAKKSDTSRTM